MRGEIIRRPQNESKASGYAKAHKMLRDKYNIGWSRGVVPRIQQGDPGYNGKTIYAYTGDVKLSTGKQITKHELTAFINKVLGEGIL